MQGIKKAHDRETKLHGVGPGVVRKNIEVYTETERMGMLYLGDKQVMWRENNPKKENHTCKGPEVWLRFFLMCKYPIHERGSGSPGTHLLPACSKHMDAGIRGRKEERAKLQHLVSNASPEHVLQVSILLANISNRCLFIIPLTLSQLNHVVEVIYGSCASWAD